MELVGPILLFCLGLILIIKCGDLFVEASRWVSGVTGIPKVVIGATLVSFATTSPEFFVSMISTLQGSVELSTGNAIGSVICNLGLPLAVFLIMRPQKNRDKTFVRQCMVMILAVLIFLAGALRGYITMLEAVLLYGVFGLFVLVNVLGAKSESQRVPTDGRDIGKHLAMFVIGLGGIILSAQLMVDNAKLIAAAFGVSETVIGLTVVAVGTSLPEIVTCFTSIAKGEKGLATGNIIGANIVNVTLIMSTSTVFSGGSLPVSAHTACIDLPVALILIALLASTIWTKKFSRWQGISMLTVYVVYTVALVLGV